MLAVSGLLSRADTVVKTPQYAELPTEQSEWHLQIPPSSRKFIPLDYPNNTDYVVVSLKGLLGRKLQNIRKDWETK
ncbi:hypothetical protein AC249_AIPGENE21601 [Exaiptasia diaphana]|nr:hypothetical protein AC249_AIPGENE21601 [Exaiptasia diaphana]